MNLKMFLEWLDEIEEGWNLLDLKNEIEKLDKDTLLEAGPSLITLRVMIEKELERRWNSG